MKGDTDKLEKATVSEENVFVLAACCWNIWNGWNTEAAKVSTKVQILKKSQTAVEERSLSCSLSVSAEWSHEGIWIAIWRVRDESSCSVSWCVTTESSWNV